MKRLAGAACIALAVVGCSATSGAARPAEYTSTAIGIETNSEAPIVPGPDGSIYFGDYGGACQAYCVRRIDADGTISVVREIEGPLDSIAVDGKGDLYIGADQVDKLPTLDVWPAGASRSRSVPVQFGKYDDPEQLAVTDSGDLFVRIVGQPRLIVLRAGATAAEDVDYPHAPAERRMAVGRKGEVYLLDQVPEPTVWKLNDKHEWAKVELGGFTFPREIAVGPDGDLFVLDCRTSAPTKAEAPWSNCRDSQAAHRDYRILRYADGVPTPVEIPIEGIVDQDGAFSTSGMVVDDDGSIFVASVSTIVQVSRR